MTKRMLKTIWTVVLLLSGGVVANANEPNVVVTPAEAEPILFLMSDTQITFLDDGFAITDGKTTMEYKFSEVNQISFSEGQAGTESVEIFNAQTLGIAICCNELTVNGWNSAETASVEIYNIAGTQCLDLRAWNGAPINVSSLATGYYIIRINNYSEKFYKL